MQAQWTHYSDTRPSPASPFSQISRYSTDNWFQSVCCCSWRCSTWFGQCGTAQKIRSKTLWHYSGWWFPRRCWSGRKSVLRQHESHQKTVWWQNAMADLKGKSLKVQFPITALYYLRLAVITDDPGWSNRTGHSEVSQVGSRISAWQREQLQFQFVLVLVNICTWVRWQWKYASDS